MAAGSPRPDPPTAADASTRVARLDWVAIEADLRARGYAQTPAILRPDECLALMSLYSDDRLFRSRIDMTRYRFGEGEYKYFAAPLPPLVQALRTGVYRALVPVAHRWLEALGTPTRYPATLAEFQLQCAARGQVRPTPLLLKYGAGGYNCLHQDLYGDLAFPFQMAVFLSRPAVDYTGGEFLLVEQRPRAQSAGEAVLPAQGEGIIFTTRLRPVRGARGYYRVNVRHGVSRVRSGTRYTLGIIFHDAR